MTIPRTQHFDNLEACVSATLARVGKRIVLGLPVGIGKPNSLVNAFVKRALADKSIQLTIFTALSLRTPRWKSDLERRFLQPFNERVFGNYTELEYVRLLESGALPDNIKINEFFLEPGGWLKNDHLQQHYLSSNYTHVARDLLARGVNVIAQLLAVSTAQSSTVSLSCNPDLTVDLLPQIESLRAAGKPFALIGQIHSDLPFMYGDAEVPRATFDFIVEQSSGPLFCPPNMPIGTVDHLIALHVSALVKDGGTLQLGIGELGDAIVYGLKLRHEQPNEFASVLASSTTNTAHAALIGEQGGTHTFTRGLYACTEMFVDGFIDLYRAGILKRRVYPHALLQTALDTGTATEMVDEKMLRALAAAGLDRLSARDFLELQTAGVFRDEAIYGAGNITINGVSIPACLADDVHCRALAATCLGQTLRNGTLLHGGFFFGPKAFYDALRAMSDDERRQFAMQRISFVNELYGVDQATKIAQRRHARFINTTMMVTGLGAAVSDGLADGRVVSGVGGQYNFIAMAHALPDARSILCVRSTRTSQGRTESNIIWNYGHITIPRHLRDIVVTEYGIADLRSRTDGEVVEALVAVMDARFQDAFVAQAKHSGKLRADYRVPESARLNTPAHLESVLQPFRQRGLFGALPFGSDFTDDEIVIAKALKQLQAATATRVGRATTLLKALFAANSDANIEHLLARLQLSTPQSIPQHIERRAVASALRRVLPKS
jgi:acyl-CoA hydrolase